MGASWSLTLQNVGYTPDIFVIRLFAAPIRRPPSWNLKAGPMLLEGRRALLLPDYSVPSCAFSRAQDPMVQLRPDYKRQYFLLLPSVNSG